MFREFFGQVSASFIIRRYLRRKRCFLHTVGYNSDAKSGYTMDIGYRRGKGNTICWKY